ncbi:protein dpcd [Histomonas meleagridis]|uniref:protein dpcd n=1 Tax=Histomonas meleagridis TaxID=135588 RepID=UPI00355A5C66|nr:protein dpcd [Histomonas meleagridis]KAH0805525.1 protein dpcd [Histomonas meleagridis]
MSVQKPKATAYEVEGFKQIMYEKDGVEIHEICMKNTGELIARRERSRTIYGADQNWVWTYGQPPNEKKEVETFELSSKNPIFFRQDTPTQWSWRVRQIPYPADNYEVTVDEAKNQIVIRTKNHKYFKRIDAPNGEKMKASDVNWNWAFNTLVITHEKPPRVIAQDKEDMRWRLSIPCQKDTDECNTQ